MRCFYRRSVLGAMVLSTFFLLAFLERESSASRELELLTFNAGLAHGYVGLSAERRPLIIKALSQSTADVICLQEVWTESDRKAVYEGIKDQYAYSYIPKIKQDRVPAPACSLSTLFGEDRLLSCFRNLCSDASGDELAGCMMKRCGSIWEKLAKDDPVCAKVFSAQAGKSVWTALFWMLNPIWDPGVFAYEGSTGIMLFSKLPFVKDQVGFIDMVKDSTTTHRGVIYAKIRVNNREHVVGCTHLTARLKDLPYPGKWTSWAQENRKQVEILTKRINDFADKGQPQYLLGDFNCGFSNSKAGIDPDLEESCKIFGRFKYSDPISMQNSECSYCSNNVLARDKDNSLIDHIFVKNLPNGTRVQSRVVLKEKVLVGFGSDEKQKLVPLSDHYGVELKLKAP